MHGFLDRKPLSGSVFGRRHLRPTRTAWLIPDNDLKYFVRQVEYMCQSWGGASDIIVPFKPSDGEISEPYLKLLRNSELEQIAVPLFETLPANSQENIRATINRSRFDLNKGVRRHPALLVAASQKKDDLRSVVSTSTAESSPWFLAYTATFGRLPRKPDRWQLTYAGARDDLSFEDILDLRHEHAEEPGLGDIKDRFRTVSPVKFNLVSLSRRKEFSSININALDGWLREPAIWARQRSVEIIVLYEPDNVADACLLWNLRAAFGWPSGTPIGIPYKREADGSLDVQAAATLARSVSRDFLDGFPEAAIVSASLSESELSGVVDTIGGSRTKFYFLPIGDVLFPSPPASRSSITTFVFQEGRTLAPTRTDEDREWLMVTGDRQLPLHLTVQVDNHPIATSLTLRGPERGPLRYSGGGVVIPAGKDTFRDVLWPQKWTMFEFAVRDHGITVRESPNGRHARSLIQLIGDPGELRWLCHRGLLDFLYKTAASSSMNWWKARATEQAKVVADAQEDPQRALKELQRLISEVSVSHDSETSGTFDFPQIQAVFGNSRRMAENWLEWADERKLVIRLVQLKCEHCKDKTLHEIGRAVPPISCFACGETMRSPFGLVNLSFRYRLSEPLRRSIADDSIYHALIMRWLISVYSNRSRPRFVGAYPGVDFYRGNEKFGEADIVLLFEDGTIIPAEVKKSGRFLTGPEVAKLRTIANLLDSPAFLLGTGDEHGNCADALDFDSEDCTCRVVTADYWLNPSPRPSFGWDDLPHWSTGNVEPPSIEEYEREYFKLLTEFKDRKFGVDDPVIRWV